MFNTKPLATSKVSALLLSFVVRTLGVQMGLLGQLLGGIASSALGRSPQGRHGGSSGVLMALLPVVLGMLANRGSSGGGLGGLLGGGGGAGGGLGGLLDQFTRHGLGQQAQSWVGTGANEPLTPDAVGQVLGADNLSQIAQQAGVSPDEARSGLAELLPEMVDHFTPAGRVPDHGKLTASVDDYLNRLEQ